MKTPLRKIPQINSFLMAGFECTYAKAENNRRFDLLAASKHDVYCRQDYQMIKARGICSVREGLSWQQIDQGNGVYDFSRFESLMLIAQEEGIQQIWDLNHFDFPEYLDPFSVAFPLQFAEYAKRCWQKIRSYQKGTLVISPLNEPSFFAWMCDNGLWAPYQKGRGTEFKKQLIKAALGAMDAIWQEDTDVIFIHADPYMYRQPLRVKNQQEQKFCEDFNNRVKFHSWDMLSGKQNPELGGDPKYMTCIGVNYYFYNQQFVGIRDNGSFSFRSLSLTNKKRLPLFKILHEIHERYNCPIVITETGSYRERRETWWSYILNEVKTAVELKIPLYGVCAYPTLDIKKGAGFIIPKSGLWDFDQRDLLLQRIPYEPALMVLEQFNKEHSMMPK